MGRYRSPWQHRLASTDFCGFLVVSALATLIAQPGSRADLRKKPRSPLTSTLGHVAASHHEANIQHIEVRRIRMSKPLTSIAVAALVVAALGFGVQPKIASAKDPNATCFSVHVFGRDGKLKNQMECHPTLSECQQRESHFWSKFSAQWQKKGVRTQCIPIKGW